MANVSPTTRRARGETLPDDTAALQRQINTLGRRLAQAQARCREQEEEVEQLRKALYTARRGLDAIASTTEEATTREEAVQGIAIIDNALDGGGDDS